MSKLIKMVLLMTLIVVVFLLSLFLELKLLSIEKYSEDSVPSTQFRILGIKDKKLPINEENISIMRPYDDSERFEEFKKRYPDFSFILPPGNYTFRREDKPETVEDDTRIINAYSESISENYLNKLRVRED